MSLMNIFTISFVYCPFMFEITSKIGLPVDQKTLQKKIRDSWIFLDQTFQGLGLGKLFLARESLVSYIPAGDGKSLNRYLQ